MTKQRPRPVVTHMHLFKNAGTSVDRCLEQNFGERWGTIDRIPADGQLLSADMVEFLQENPHLQAVSSHHLRPPLSAAASISFLPIVFLRHPMDRIASAYTFEHRQEGSSPSSAAALEHDLAGWIDWHNSRGSVQCANFHCMMLTADRQPDGRRHQPTNAELHRISAQAFLSSLQAYGIVEQYERSWEVIERTIHPDYPDFRRLIAQENTTARSATLADRLKDVRTQLGDDRYAALESSNSADMELYAWAVDYFEVVAAGDHIPTAAPQPSAPLATHSDSAPSPDAGRRLVQKRDDLRNRKNATHNSLTHLQAQLQQDINEHVRLRTEFDRSRRALSDAQDTLQAKKDAVKEAQRHADAAMKAQQDLKRRHREELQESSDRRSKRRAALQDAQRAVTAASAEKGRLAEKVASVRTKLREATARQLEAKRAADKCRAEFSGLDDALRTLRETQE